MVNLTWKINKECRFFRRILPKDKILRKVQLFFKFASRNLQDDFSPASKSAEYDADIVFALMYALTLRVDALSAESISNIYMDFSSLVRYILVSAIHTSYYHWYHLRYFLPDFCNSATRYVKVNARARKGGKRDAEKKRAAGSSGQHRERYRRIANKGIARSANNTGALSQSRGDS